MDRERILAECYRIIEETGDLEAWFARFPEARAEIEADLELIARIRAGVRTPAPLKVSTGRQQVLSHLAMRRSTALRRHKGVIGRLRWLGAAAGLALVASAVVGAGAAPDIPSLLSGLGVFDRVPEHARQKLETIQRGGVPASVTPLAHEGGENHGGAVSEAVHEAIESTDPGPERGRTVRQAACEAAHDRSTLPTPAQNAPGLADKDREFCTFVDEEGDETVGTQQGPPSGNPGRGHGPPEANPGRGQGPPDEHPGQGQGPPDEHPGQGQGPPDEHPGQGQGPPAEPPGNPGGPPAENPGRGGGPNR
jgi:hypothetical protein